MAEKRKAKTGKPAVKPAVKPTGTVPPKILWLFFIPVMAVTFLLFLPALQNGFTNWDDILYVTQNPLLKNLNGEGLRAIFSTPVVSNYHPLTIISLALDYQVAELKPMPYHLTAVILHTLNTGLVFWFIYALSGKNAWVSAAVALLFGIHPMHVESVAWVSERKDLLYTLFYVGAMIAYLKYLRQYQWKYLALTTILGGISLLCKPAAIVLPLSLLCIDYFLKRPWSAKWVLEKLPLFVFAAIMAYVTFHIQAKKAVATVEAHGFLERICYAGFGWVWYLLKIILPIPLSALHPFPKTLTPPYYLATGLAIAVALYALWKVRNRHFLFGFGFYTVNLLLVLQVVSIGNAVVAERYTYVPYIGIFFWAAMGLYTLLTGVLSRYKYVVLGLLTLWICVLGFLTVMRIPVWKSSQTLWEDVIKTYPNSARAWTNKGLDYYDEKKWTDAIYHLSKALICDSIYANALEWRARVSLEVGEYDHALEDASKFYRHYPEQEQAAFLLARSYGGKSRYEEAIRMYDELIARYGKAEYYNNRGVIFFNAQKKIAEARADFEAAIRIDPNNGGYYLNLSRCYYVSQDIPSARKYGARAQELGAQIEANYARAIGL